MSFSSMFNISSYLCYSYFFSLVIALFIYHFTHNALHSLLPCCLSLCNATLP